MKRHATLLLLVLTFGAPVLAESQAPSAAKSAAQDEFVPVNAPTNPQDAIPAPRLIASAYGFMWIMLLGYLWSVSSSVSKVEREIEAVNRRLL